MSTAIAKNFQVGADPTPTNNFTIRQPVTPDGTVRIANGNSGTTTDLVTLTSAGNLGVGVTTVNGKLDVKTASDSKIVFNDGTTTGNVRLEAVNIAYSAYKPFETNASIQLFATGGTERMRIDSSGNVGIGKTSPQASLDYRETVNVISTSTTAVASRTYVFTASLTLTLPASPTAGDWVAIQNSSGTTTAVIARNGSNIMSLAENMTIDNATASLTLVYADATRGWVLSL